MPTIIGPLPVTLQNGTTADATQVMSDFNWIVNQVNANGLATGYISPGALVAVQVFTSSGTYTPNAAATKAIVEGVGGGGGGGGTQITGAASTAAGGGGGSGAYGKIWIPSGLATQTVTIGAAGGSTSGGGGIAGGTTSFGTLMSLPGGTGGGLGVTQSVYPQASGVGPGSSGAPTGTGTFIFSIPGAGGSSSIVLANSLTVPGAGGSNPLGNGGVGTISSGTSTQLGVGQGYGAGGAGFTSFNIGANQTGYSGTAGIIIVYEYA